MFVLAFYFLPVRFYVLRPEECSKTHEPGFRLVCFLDTRWQKSIVSKMDILTISMCEDFFIMNRGRCITHFS